MVVLIGIDMGNFEIKISYGDCIEDILTNHILKIENVISFTEHKRYFGTQAKKNLLNEHSCNSFYGLKWLLAKKFDNKRLELFLKLSCFNSVNQLDSDANQLIRLKTSQIEYFKHAHLFYPEELYTMILSYIRNQIVSLLNLDENESIRCVMSVPFYYTLIERELLLKCCKAADLKCLNLCNDTTGVCLYYIFTKQNLLSNESQLVIVIDMGELALQISYAHLWDCGIKILHTQTFENFGGQNFDYKLLEKILSLDSFQGVKQKMNHYQLKLLVYREFEKAKAFGFSSSFEMRITKDFSYVLTKEDFEYSCAELFGLFNIHLRQSYEDFAQRFKLSSLNPSSCNPLNVLISGSAMKLSKLKEIVKHVFNVEPKMMSKDVIAKGCMLMADLLANKKKNIQVFDHLSYDLFTAGQTTMSCLVNRFTYTPTKLLIRNVDFSEIYNILVDNKYEFGQFVLSSSASNAIKSRPKLTSWKVVLKSSGALDRLEALCDREESGKEIKDQDTFTWKFHGKLDVKSEKDWKKNNSIFGRLEKYFEEGNMEQYALQLFIYESLLYIKSISKHLPDKKTTEFVCMLEEEEKWLEQNECKDECLIKLEHLNTILNNIKTKKEMYDKCLERLRDYERIIEENDDFCLIESTIDNFNKNMDDFHARILKKLLDDHKQHFQLLMRNIFHNNILEISAEPDLIDQKIKLLLTDKHGILLKCKQKQEELGKLCLNNDNKQNEDCFRPSIKHHFNLDRNPSLKQQKRVRFKDEEEESEDYEVLKFDQVKSRNSDSDYDQINMSEAIDVSHNKPKEPPTKTLNKVSKNINLRIMGTEISTKGSIFSLRLQNFKGTLFPTEWNLDIRLDKREYRVQVDPMSEEFDMVSTAFKPISDSNSNIISVWRIQNEHLWANFFTRKNKMKIQNELHLWYGCDGAYYKHVCENNCQFRRSTFKCPDYGLGVYFYRDCTDAHKNVKPFYNVYYMFLCKVLTGKTTLGSGSISKLPKGYHTARDKKSVSKSSLFVVPRENTDQIYPLYLIAYHVKN